jgi:hypothetical protein
LFVKKHIFLEYSTFGGITWWIFISVRTRITRILQTVLFYGILHLAALPSHRQIFHLCGSTMGFKAIMLRLWSANKSDAHSILTHLVLYNYYSNKMHTSFIIKITRYYNL